MKNEKYKRLFRFAAMIANAVFQIICFYEIWIRYYNSRIDQSFARRGNWLIAGLYFLVLLLFTHVYGGFKIGYQKPGSLALSQALSLIGTNVFALLLTLILSRNLLFAGNLTFLWPKPKGAGEQMISILPYLALTAVQTGGTTMLAALLTRIYDAVFPPRRLLLIYGEYEEAAHTLAAKMNGMKEKYQIAGMVNQSLGQTALQEQISKYQGVVLLDVEAGLRNHLIKYCYGMAIRVYVAPNLSDIILGGAEKLHFFDSPLLLARNSGLSIEQKLAKRVLDLFISGLGILITAPFMAVIALAIKLGDGGPVFFRQDRVTAGGKVFRITKFRSMVVDAEKAGYAIPATDRDPRITPVGRILRAIRMDELPQLFDIFRGDMSVVGPRPERVEHVEKYTESVPEFVYRLKIKGGLTGYAQIFGKYNTSAYDKLKLDLMYIENYSVLLDLKLILMTVKIMFTKESTEGFTEEKSADMQGALREKKGE